MNLPLPSSVTAPAHPMLPLRGKNLAVLCDDPHCERLSQLAEAAVALGAKVTHIRPTHAQLLDPATLVPVSQVLGRLYDGLECHGLSEAMVDLLGRASSRPVWAGGDCHARIDAPALRVWLLSVLS